MMEELEEVHRRISPHEVILVLDAMTGQDAVQAAAEFHRRVPLTGIILTKLDGDARGGAALSVTKVTGIPIKFLGMGERVDALDPFYPDRLASRILGMGDVLSLVEKAQQVVDKESGEGDGAEAAAGELRPGGLSGAVAEREADGVFGAVHGDDSGVFQDEQAASRRGDRRWGVEEG